MIAQHLLHSDLPMMTREAEEMLLACRASDKQLYLYDLQTRFALTDERMEQVSRELSSLGLIEITNAARQGRTSRTSRLVSPTTLTPHGDKVPWTR